MPRPTALNLGDVVDESGRGDVWDPTSAVAPRDPQSSCPDHGRPGLHGRRTASGERLNTNDLTGAHPNLPFGSKVRVTNLANNRSVVVRINDRGPFGGKRVIDVSRKAAEQLGMLRAGTAQVQLTLEQP